jgi:hypothetical protein
MTHEGGGRAFSTEGAVVEILERGGERFAKIVLDPGTVLELPAPSMEISLGDRVMVDASLRIERVRPRPDPPAAAPRAAGDSPHAFRGSERPTFRDFEHVLRVAGLFALAIAGFLIWRSWMVPPDFGRYGHFRAGAIAEAASLEPVYAGQQSCLDCHTDVQEVRQTGRHRAIACEACHEPLGDHARGEAESAPVRPSPRATCLSCHAAKAGMPLAFPRVIEREHSEAGPCTTCHRAHAPGL